MADPPELLARHLRSWLGNWPPSPPLTVVGSALRTRPGWDGTVHTLIGVGTPAATLLSVPPERVAAVRTLSLAPDAAPFGPAVAQAVGRPGTVLGCGVFRWSLTPADLPPAGEWMAVEHPAVPAWLRPFGSPVLVALGDRGDYLAGVGLKRHDHLGRELAVGTAPHARGRGLARRLVAQAARRVVADGFVATYLHEPSNAASARVADAAGFSDAGWSVYGLFAPQAPQVSERPGPES